jgi:hypothetical protein
MDVEIDMVQKLSTQARFFRHKEKDYVEISFIGNPDTVVRKVTPDVMAQYRDQWNAYCDGVPLKQRKGTPLTDLKEISEERAAEFIRRNVHTLDELSVLNDAQCQGLGHGTIMLRKAAQALIAQRAFQEKNAAQKKISEVVAPVKDHHPEMQALKDIVAEQASKIDKLADLVLKLAEDKPAGKKKKNGAKLNPGNNEPSV